MDFTSFSVKKAVNIFIFISTENKYNKKGKSVKCVLMLQIRNYTIESTVITLFVTNSENTIQYSTSLQSERCFTHELKEGIRRASIS
jgi:hypothetical protein